VAEREDKGPGDVSSAQDSAQKAGTPGKLTRSGQGHAEHADPVSVDRSTRPAPSSAAERLGPWETGASFLSAVGLGRDSSQDPAVHRSIAVVRLGLAHLPILQGALLDAFHRAVAALDAQGARALALQIVGGLAQVEQLPARVREWVPQLAEDGHPEVLPVSSFLSAPVVAENELDELPTLYPQLLQALESAVTVLAVQVSPQTLGGQLTTGAAEAPTRARVKREGSTLVAQEASMVIELLEAAERIAPLVHPSQGEASSAAPAADLTLAVAELERFRSRPVHLMFLTRALQQCGLWQELEHAQGTGGRTAGALLRSVEDQAESTGATADVGQWDAARAERALGYGLGDWAITDSEGMEVIDMLRSASPQARGGLVKQLHRMGKLDRLAENVGWQHLKQLADSMSDPEAEALLAPHWQRKGGVPSSGEFFTEQVDRNIAEGGTLNTLQAFDWYFTNLALNAFSFGGKSSIDSAHQARDAGWISEDGYWAEANKAFARTITVGAAAMATGGAAGAWAEGAAATLGAGEGAAAIVGGAVGGGAGNVGARFVGDVYDQALSGKEGFDGPGEYARDFASGGLVGAALAPVGYYGAKYLPESALTLGQLYAVRHPELIRLLEASRAAGANAAFRLRVTAQEWIRIVDGGGLGPMGPALATAEGADVAHLPPDAELWITARPKINLEASQARLGDEVEPWLEVQSIETGSGPREGWRDALGSEDPSIQGMHEIDPLGEEPHLRRLPAAKDIDPQRSPENANSGFWEDNNARGNVPWHADNSDVNRATQYGPVEFKNSYPVLEPYALETVRLKQTTGSRKDIAAADIELAKRFGKKRPNGTPDKEWAEKYRRSERLSWHHHEDGKTMLPIPRELHENLPHSGGASVARGASLKGRTRQ
jgi:hypothetical protein